MILGDMPSRKKQDPQIKDLADNFAGYVTTLLCQPQKQKSCYIWLLMAIFSSL